MGCFRGLTHRESADKCMPTSLPEKSFKEHTSLLSIFCFYMNNLIYAEEKCYTYTCSICSMYVCQPGSCSALSANLACSRLAQIFTARLSKHSLQPNHLELLLIKFHKVNGFGSGQCMGERSL